MPDLLDIRNFIQNNLDYAPVNESWRASVDSFINDVYFRIFTGKAYDFAQKVVRIPVYKDRSLTVSWSGSLATPLTCPPSEEFPLWCEGQLLEINGVEYEIAYRVDAQNVYMKQALSGGAIAGLSVTLKNRYIDLPADCTYILNVSRRTNAITARNVGQYTAISRFEDEYHNLPLDEISVPAYWVKADDEHTLSPRNINFSIAAAPAGNGNRTVEIAVAYVQRGAYEAGYRFSSLSNPVSVSLTDAERLNVNYADNFRNQGFYKALFVRNTEANIYTWRRLDLVKPDASVGTVTYVVDAALFTTGNALLNTNEYPVFNGADGTCQRIRLYPRQDEDYEISVRYIYRPLSLNEDQDTPELPPAQHMLLGFAALEQLSMMTNNDSRAGYYHAKTQQMIEELDARYLTSPARRFVKAYMGNGLTNPVPMYTNLRRLP